MREEKKIAINPLETTSQFNPFSVATTNPQNLKRISFKTFLVEVFFLLKGNKKCGSKRKLEKTEDIV